MDIQKFIIPAICIILWFAFVLYLSRDVSPDLSSDYQDERQCQDFGEGKGCW